MADVPAMRAAYQRLGFSANAATRITDDQQIDSLGELKLLTDGEIENLCKVLRRPGGTIPNPQAATAGQPPRIPNPGEQVSLRAENNLKLASYYLKHQERVSRTPAAADITLANVRKLRELRQFEQSYETTDDSIVINPRDWPKTIEGIQEYLRSYLGETKIPLAYVIRENVDPPADPDPSTGYTTVQDEMISRAPHKDAAGDPHPTFVADSKKVWELLSATGREMDCWTYLKPAQKKLDGRAAFWGLFNNYLGPNNVDNMASLAEKKLESTTYSGERKRWNFEKYVKVHMDQHSILQGLTEHGYVGIDERSKVRHLMAGIKTKDLDSVKTQIMASATLRSDFQGCVTLYKDFIAQNKSTMNPSLTISAVLTGKRKHKGGEDRDIEDRYYTNKEYAKLPPHLKHKLKKLREARGHVVKGKRPDKEKQKENIIAGLNRTVSSIKTALDGLGLQDTNSQDSDKETEDDNKGGGNRNNPALLRQKTAKGEKG